MATEISENLPEISENLPEISENLPEISENLPEISETFFHKMEHCCYRAESKFRTSKNHMGLMHSNLGLCPVDYSPCCSNTEYSVGP